MEVYSIDESFLSFHGFENYNLYDYGRKIVRTVTKGTGILVSMGVAATKILAKVDSKYAKKYKGYDQGGFTTDLPKSDSNFANSNE